MENNKGTIPVPPLMNGPEEIKATVGDIINNGANRINDPKVAQHIIPPKVNFHSVNNATSASGQTVGSQSQNFNASQNNQTQYVNTPPKVNQKLILDFNLLDSINSTCEDFITSNPLGRALKMLSDTTGTKISTKYNETYHMIDILLGNTRIFFIMGMDKQNSPMYSIPQSVNMRYYALGNNELTQACFMPWFNKTNQKASPTALVFYEDDVALSLHAVVNMIYKCAFPEATYKITEDQYVNMQCAFNIIDTKTAVDDEMKNSIKEFRDTNNPSALITQGSDYIALSVSSGWMNQFQNGFGNSNINGCFMNGEAPNSFGMNNMMGGAFGGGYGGYGFQPARPKTNILASAKYYLSKDKAPNGIEYTTAHITELVELGHVVVDKFIKYFIMYFKSLGYEIELNIELAAVTPNMRDTIMDYFRNLPSVTGSYFDMMSTYVNPQTTGANGKLRRIHPSTITLKAFSQYYPDIAKDAKFPKVLTNYDDKRKFEEFKAKAGFHQIINPGEMKFIFNDMQYMEIAAEYNWRLQAHNNGLTLEEFTKKFSNQNGGQQQQQQQNPQQQMQQPMMGNSCFGGMNPMMGMGGMNPMMGMGGMNPMMGMGGMQQFSPFGGMGMQQMPMMNNMNNMNHQGKKPGQMQGNPYMMNNMNSMMGGMNPMMGMGSMQQFSPFGGMGMQQMPMMNNMNGGYMPGVTIGNGALPSSNQSGSPYIPNC